MRLPFVQEMHNSSKRTIDVFKGYNHNLYTQDNEFYDMQNMSSDYFPILSPRQPRGKVIRKFTKPNGLFAKNKLAYVDGMKFYFDDIEKGIVTDTEKVFISMGAYILIFPDKAYYNTFDGKFGSLEVVWTQSSKATFSKVNDSTFTKIQCTGINEGFSKFDAVEIAGCTNTSINKTAIIQDVDKDFIVVIADIEKQFTQASGMTVSRNIPQMDYVTENNNRIFGCNSEKHEIYASKLGDPFNWQCFEGISTDSYAATIGSDGDFTGVVSHLGYVLFFKEDCVHKIYGSKPQNYQITTNNIRGVAAGSERSLCIVNETLYYKTRTGVAAYEGGMPYNISDALGVMQYKNAVAGRCGNKYYISMQDHANKWSMFAFDTLNQLWHKEDSTGMKYTTYHEGVLYYIDAKDFSLKTMIGDSEERIEWYVETGNMMDGVLDNKYISKLQINCSMEKGSMLIFYMKSESDFDWKKVKAVNSTSKRTFTIPIIPRRGQYFKLKIWGYGDCKIYGMSKSIEVGSEV